MRDMATKPCNTPGCNQPRMVTAGGAVMPHCRPHQNEVWARRNRSKKKPGPDSGQREKLPPGYHKCHRCGEVKTDDQFTRQGKYIKGVCKPCFQMRKAEQDQPKGVFGAVGDALPPRDLDPRPVRHGLVLVDRERETIVLCEIMSEIKTGDLRTSVEFIADFYRQRGYRVQDAVERIEAPHGIEL